MLTLETFVYLVSFASLAILFYQFPKYAHLYGEVLHRFVEMCEGPAAKDVLSEDDYNTMGGKLQIYALRAIIFAIAGMLAVVSSIIIIGTNQFGPLLKTIFIMANAGVFANLFLYTNTCNYVRWCESEIGSRVISEKAAKFANKRVADADDVVAWINHENELLEKEMRESGEDATFDDEETPDN